MVTLMHCNEKGSVERTDGMLIRRKRESFADIDASIMFSRWFMFLICSLKIECEKLAQEKTEMQRHYVMVSWADELMMQWNCLIYV